MAKTAAKTKQVLTTSEEPIKIIIDQRLETSAVGLASLFSMSSVAVAMLVKQGVIPRIAEGRFNLIRAVSAYVLHLKSERKPRPKSEGENTLRAARAREIQVRTDERLGKLVSVEDFDAMIDTVVGGFRSELSGLPSRCTRDLALRRTMEREINGLLQRVTLLAEQHAARLEAGRSIDEAIEDDDAGSVGDDEPDISGGGGNSRAA